MSDNNTGIEDDESVSDCIEAVQFADCALLEGVNQEAIEAVFEGDEGGIEEIEGVMGDV